MRAAITKQGAIYEKIEKRKQMEGKDYLKDGGRAKRND